MIKKYVPTFLTAILAGLIIVVGASAYLCLENHTLGAILFTIGLFTIYTLDFSLFTGKVGYLFTDKTVTVKKIIIIWCGNFAGAFVGAYAILATRLVETTNMVVNVKHYAEIKIADGYVSVFILAMFCGIMMYIAAETYKRTQHTANSTGGYIGLFLVVMTFLLLGFEHSIANIFYFTLAQVWSVEAFVALLVASLGNAVGGMLIPNVLKLANIK